MTLTGPGRGARVAWRRREEGRLTSTYPDHLRRLVDEYLGSLDFGPTRPEDAEDAEGTGGLVEAMRHSLLAGGKRIRPVLALAACESLGRDPRELLPTAAALELIHTYSLIHDDLPAMDDDDLRRGRPTCHRIYGEATAILAGDALYAEAVRLICELQSGDPGVRVEILGELSRATGVHGMVGGQYLDLADAGGESPEALRRVHRLKTGRLIACAVRCALIVTDPPEDVQATLRAFADEVGLLFQIVDDILDVSGTEADLGKSVGADERQGKITYVSVHGLDEARRLAADSHARARALLDELPDAGGALAAITDLVHARDR